MQLLPFATETHVDEALRLFQVSTLEAASCKALEGKKFCIVLKLSRWYFLINLLCLGAEGFTTDEHRELLLRIEKQLKRRFPIGAQISESTIIQDFIKQVCKDGFLFQILSDVSKIDLFFRNTPRELFWRLSIL